MKSTMFECNQDLVKNNCSLQEWQQYLYSFHSCNFRLPSTTSCAALNNLSAGAIFGTSAPPYSKDCKIPCEEASPEALTPLGTTKLLDNMFTFDLQDFDSWEGYDPSKISDSQNFTGSQWDFDYNFDQMFSDAKVVPKTSVTDLENSPLSQNSTKDSKESKWNTRKQIRWRKSNDKELFRELKFTLRKYGLSMEEFIKLGKLGNEYGALNELLQKIKWRGSNITLVERICKLKAKEKYLSYRDFKQLRKLYYQQLRNQNVDWDFLLFEFPGRTLEYIKEVCFSFPRRESILEKSSCNSS